MRGRERQVPEREQSRGERGPGGPARERPWDDPTEFRAMGPSHPGGHDDHEHRGEARGWHGERADSRSEYHTYQGREPQPRNETGYGDARPPESGWGWSPSRGGGERGASGERYERRPDFIGKGPKGYLRSDERVREHVCERLSEGYLDASAIEVAVEQGVVVLTGTVSDKRAKRIAEDLAEACPGVTEVDNRLRLLASRRA